MDRLRDWFAACVRAAVASLPYAGRYRYSVDSCNFAAQTLDLSPLDPSQPALDGVPMRTPGLRIDVAPGTEVLVGYAGMDPTRPEVTSFGNDPESITRVEIIGRTTPAAFQGMAVQVTIPQGAVLVASPSPPGFAPNPTPIPLDGTITGGSDAIFGG